MSPNSVFLWYLVILWFCFFVFLADVAVGWLGSSVVLWWVVFVWCFSVV